MEEFEILFLQPFKHFIHTPISDISVTPGHILIGLSGDIPRGVL